MRNVFIFLQDLADLEVYRAALKEVNMYISQVENIVSTKLETTNRFVDPQEEYKTSKVRNCQNVLLWTYNAKSDGKMLSRSMTRLCIDNGGKGVRHDVLWGSRVFVLELDTSQMFL